IVSITTLAFAGKEERDFRKNTVEPAIAGAKKAYKTGCGCDLKFEVKWDDFTTWDQLSQLRYTAENFSENAPDYCKDPASKKAMCQMKSFEISIGKETAFAFKGGKGIATTDGHASVSWGMITGAVDK